MEQSPVHGVDQQERLLCWLGGIIDGEGCITISHHQLKNKYFCFIPIIDITNTSKTLIDQCAKILFDVDIPFHVMSRSQEQLQKSDHTMNARKGRWNIRILGLKRVAKALNILSPYIREKQPEVKLVKLFCDRRLNVENVNYKRYDAKDLDIIEQVIKIHGTNPQRLHAEILACKARNKI